MAQRTALRLAEDIESLSVDKHLNALVLVASKAHNKKARGFPDRKFWKPNYGHLGAWVFSPTARNIDYCLNTFPEAVWTKAAKAMIKGVLDQRKKARSLQKSQQKAAQAKGKFDLTASDFKFSTKYPPFEHQEHVFSLSRDHEEFALFMEMGTGKTRVIVDTATYLAQAGKIDSVLVICPNSIKDTWVEEVDQMAPGWSSHSLRVWSASASKKQKDEIRDFVTIPERDGALKWLVVNVEGLGSSKAQVELCEIFVALGKTLIVVDESSRIKTFKAKRTKAVIKLGDRAAYRRIMSGTPITQGPLDLFTQFKFLDHHILGFGSYYAFRNRYAVMGGFNQKEVIGYSNIEELVELTEPYTYRVTRAECLDLPPKVFQRLTVELTKEQRSAYKSMKDDMIASIGGSTVSATIVLTQLLRLQQIVGGFLPVVKFDPLTELEERHSEPIHGRNAKVDALMDLLTDADRETKVIVWARFRAEIGLIANTLRAKFGATSVAEFHGGTSVADRKFARLSFQNQRQAGIRNGKPVIEPWPESPVRFFVGQTETGGLGITLTQASIVVYYSNSFSLESRLQSEDRAHRIGQKKTVTYIDLVAKSTLDLKLLSALRSKKNLADMITGDDWQGWI